MQLFHQTIQVPTAIHSCINGNFTGKSPKREEIVFVRGATFIELVSPDTQTTGKFKTIKIDNTFSIIRGLASFCFLGDDQDHLAVTSDSGCLVVLKFLLTSCEWKQIFVEAYGKSGLKRGIPGHFLAADPHGRAIMIASAEKSKLAFTFSKDEEAGDEMIINSPLEAHRNKFISEGLVAIDTGHDNPLFAAIEIPFDHLDDEESSIENIEKRLTFYQIQLGLNSISRKVSQVVEFETNFIFPLLSGVLLTSDLNINFCRPGLPPITHPLPQRLPTSGYTNRPAIIINGTVILVKEKPLVLLQNDLGDLFKVDVDLPSSTLSVRYFDSIPTCNSIILLKSGFLFTASESTEHCLYQLESLGEDDEDCILETFSPRPSPKNLICVSTLINHSIVSHAHINANGEIWTLRGRGANNAPSLDILRTCISIEGDKAASLDCLADSVWAFNDKLIYSGPTGTFILNSGSFNTTHLTLYLKELANDHFVQVFENSFIIFPSKNYQEHVFQWMAPAKHKITHFESNERQALLILNHKIVVYFELDDNSMILREHSKTIQMDSSVLSLSLSPIREGMLKGLIVAVGTSDSVIHILSLRQENLFYEMTSQVCAANPTGLLLSNVISFSDNISRNNQESSTFFMQVGLANGVYIRMDIDPNSGELLNPYTKAFSSAPLKIKLLKGSSVFGEERVQYSHIVIKDGEQVWIATRNSDLMRLDHPFKDISIIGENYYGLGFDDQIIKFTVPEVDSKYSIERIPLILTPTRLQLDDDSGLVIICEGERATCIESDIPLWNSFVRIWNPQDKISSSFTSVIQMTGNELATCGCFMRFSARPGAMYLIVGSARDFSPIPRKSSQGCLYTYLIQSDGTKPQLVHKTEFVDADEFPTSVIQFSGKLLCGVGGHLRLYEMGKQRLLMKCSISLPSAAVNIQTQGLRIMVLDSRASLLMYYYRPDDNRFYLVADEITCRPPTNTLLCLDYDTWALGDRFGGIAVLRLDRKISEELDTDPGSSRLNQPSTLFSAPIKLERLAYFHLGEVVVGLGKVIGAHGRTSIRYMTMSGGVGMLAPLITKSQVDILESTQLSSDVGLKERASLTARNHAWFRSWYYPVANVFDGDLLSNYVSDRDELRQVINTLQSIYL